LNPSSKGKPVNEQLIKLRFTIDRLTLRERILLVVGLSGMILCIWFYLLYTPQQRALETARTDIGSERTQIATIEQKRQIIQTLSTDNTVQKLMAKFERLKAEMKKFDFKSSQHANRYISEKELAKLLYSILDKTDSVSIEHFGNVDYIQPQLAETISPDALKKAVAETVVEQQTEPSAEAPPVERVQYQLILKGNYFSILAYLEHLEQLKWELYWDKLDYKVTKHPEATAKIQFYTLKPQNDLALPHEESAP
jgi:MSHA biogenesis protein MshJ